MEGTISKAKAHNCVEGDELCSGDFQTRKTQIHPSSDTGVQRLAPVGIQCLRQGLSLHKVTFTF